MEIFVSKKSGKNVKVRNIYRAVCSEMDDAFMWAAVDAENLAKEYDKTYPYSINYSIKDGSMEGFFSITKRSVTQINVVVFEEDVDKDIYDNDDLIIYVYKGNKVAMKNCYPANQEEWNNVNRD